MILFLSVLLIVVFILYSWIKVLQDAKNLKLPGPSPLPIVGNGNHFLGDSANFLTALQSFCESYGGITRFYILSYRYVLISEPKYVEALTTSTEYLTKGRSYSFLHPWLGQGLLTSTGNRWKTHRKFLTPAFHFNILQNFFEVFLKNDNIFIKKLQSVANNGNEIELFSLVALLALDNVTETIMAECVNAQTDSESEYVKAVSDLSSVLAYRIRDPFAAIDPVFNLMPSKKTHDNAISILHKYSKNVIEARRKKLESLKINSLNLDGKGEYGTTNKHAFLDLLLLAEIDGKRMDDEAVREEVDTFMFEGHDTTTSGIAFAIYCLSKNKDVQEKLLKEQRAILGDDLEREPTYNDMKQMKYLDLVIKESLRLFPSVPLIERLITKDTELAGVFIPKNTSTIVNIMQMQRNPTIFENPLEFRPERFEDPLKHPFSWLAFSAGPRNCIGQKFAMLELKVTISSVVRRFKILPTDPEPILGADLILRSLNGVNVILKER